MLFYLSSKTCKNIVNEIVLESEKEEKIATKTKIQYYLKNK